MNIFPLQQLNLHLMKYITSVEQAYHIVIIRISNSNMFTNQSKTFCQAVLNSD